MVLVRSLAVFLEKFEVVAAYKVQDEGLAALACGLPSKVFSLWAKDW